jgi:hypothetical protein
MRGIELACAAIVAVYVALRLRSAGSSRTAVALRLAALASAAWVGEDSVIRAYGFYGYAPEWSAMLDRVPLLIVAIWPVVIDSAHGLARQLASGAARVALLAGAIVLADASLIEPIAVHAGLWSWSAGEPRALFAVPLVGVVGWSLFATAAVAVFEALDGESAQGAARSTPDARAARAAWSFAVVAVAPLATHVALVAVWWGAFRWFGAGTSPWTPPLVAWGLLGSATAVAWRAGPRASVASIMARAPGAAFFFVLLAATARDSRPLVAYALAFAPPYVALVARAASRALYPLRRSSYLRVSPSRSNPSS